MCAGGLYVQDTYLGSLRRAQRVCFDRVLDRCRVGGFRDAYGVHEVDHDPVGHDIAGVEVMFISEEAQVGDVERIVARGRAARSIRWRGSAHRAPAWIDIMAVPCHEVGCHGRRRGRDDLVSNCLDRWAEGRELLPGGGR